MVYFEDLPSTNTPLNAENLNKMNFFTDGVNINSGDDLNNYTEYGVYKSQNANISASLINTPTTSVGFRMEVFPITAAERLIQKIYCNNNAGTQYFRTYTSSGWQAWRTYTTTII